MVSSRPHRTALGRTQHHTSASRPGLSTTLGSAPPCPLQWLKHGVQAGPQADRLTPGARGAPTERSPHKQLRHHTRMPPTPPIPSPRAPRCSEIRYTPRGKSKGIISSAESCFFTMLPRCLKQLFYLLLLYEHRWQRRTRSKQKAWI